MESKIWKCRQEDPIVLILDWRDMHQDWDELLDNRFEVLPAYWVLEDEDGDEDDGHWSIHKPDDQHERDVGNVTARLFGTLAEAEEVAQAIRKTHRRFRGLER